MGVPVDVCVEAVADMASRCRLLTNSVAMDEVAVDDEALQR